MSTTYQGHYLVIGSDIAGTTGIVTGSKWLIQSAEFNRESETVRVKDANGQTVGVAFTDYADKLTIVATPYDADTQTDAATNFDVPAMGTKCTITAPTSIQSATATTKIAGDWVLTSASLRLRSDGNAEITATLERFPNVTLR